MSLLYLDTLTLYGSAAAMSAAGLSASGTGVAFDASGGVEGRPCMVVTGSGQVVVPTDGSYNASFPAVNHAQIYIGFRMKVVTPPAASSTTVLSVWQAGSRVIDIDLTPILGIKANDNLGSPYSGGQRVQAFKQGAWHSVSIECARGSLTGSIRAYVDGVSVLAAYNLDTDVSGGDFVKIQIGDSGNPAIFGHELHFDNLVIHDADGSDYSASQRWHGMAAQLPDATDSVPNVVVGAASAHLAVDDAAGTDSDGDTSYVEPLGEIEPATLSFPALPAGSVKTPQVVMGLCEVKVGTGAASGPKLRIELDDEREDFPLDLAVGYEVWRGHTFDQPGTTDAWSKVAAESTRIEVAADSWPSSVVAVEYGDPWLSVTGSDVDSMLEQQGTIPSSDLTQTGAPRPTLIDDSGTPAVQFDRSVGEDVAVTAGSDVIAAGEFPTLLLLARLRSTNVAPAWQWWWSVGAAVYSCALYYNGSLKSSMVTPEGQIVTTQTFSDTADYHVFRATLTPAGLVTAIDGVEGTPVATANTGISQSAAKASIGDSIGAGGNNGDINVKRAALLVGASAADIAAAEGILLALVP